MRNSPRSDHYPAVRITSALHKRRTAVPRSITSPAYNADVNWLPANWSRFRPSLLETMVVVVVLALIAAVLWAVFAYQDNVPNQVDLPASALDTSALSFTGLQGQASARLNGRVFGASAAF